MSSNVQALMEDYGGGEGDTPWSNNLLATDAERLPSGRFVRRREGGGAQANGASDDGLADAAEEVARLAVGMRTGMGSEGGEGLEPFYVAAAQGATLDEPYIREIFGDALFPKALITIEALSEGTKWWSTLGEDVSELARWRTLLVWFSRGPFVETAFVAIDAPQNPYNSEGGSVFPRLLLGRRSDGAILGLLGVVVHT